VTPPDRLSALEKIQRALEMLEKGYFGATRALLIDAKKDLHQELSDDAD
jgi:hypothetical protein